MNDTILEAEAGSKPLKAIKYEIYARERAVCASPERAAQRAGYPPRCGAHTRLERRQDVRDRIAWLTGDDARLIREKRRRIEEQLNLVVETDMMEFAEIDEATGALVSIDWRKVKESPSSVVISDFAFNADGNLTRFGRDDRMNAISQLRDMHGFKAPSKIAPTNPQGDGPMEGEIKVTLIDSEHAA